MNHLKRTPWTTVGKKALVGITGLGLVAFLIVHLYDNLLLYRPDHGAEFNKFAHWLHSQAWLPAFEIGLLAFFLIHIGLTIRLTLDNRAARGQQRYAVRATKRSGWASVLASRTMAISGLIVLAFLIVHIWDFRLQNDVIAAQADGVYGAVVTKLEVPWRFALYLAGSLLIGWHMFHGIQSAFRSLGYHNSRVTPWIVYIGSALAWILGLGFASLPIWIFFFHPGH